MEISELSIDQLSSVVGGADPSKCFFQPKTETDYKLAAAMVKGARKEGGKALVKGHGQLPYYRGLLDENLCVAPVPKANP